MATEYRVVWQREGEKINRSRAWVRLYAVKRFMLRFGPYPWEAFGRKAGDPFYERGIKYHGEDGDSPRTQEEVWTEIIKGRQHLISLRVECRQVGEWKEKED